MCAGLCLPLYKWFRVLSASILGVQGSYLEHMVDCGLADGTGMGYSYPNLSGTAGWPACSS